MNYPPLSLKISPSLESTQQKRLRELFTKQTRKTETQSEETHMGLPPGWLLTFLIHPSSP
jgi:hypothetical protein